MSITFSELFKPVNRPFGIRFAPHKQKIKLPCKQSLRELIFFTCYSGCSLPEQFLLTRSIFLTVPRMPCRVLPRHRTSSTTPYFQGFSGIKKSCTPVCTQKFFRKMPFIIVILHTQNILALKFQTSLHLYTMHMDDINLLCLNLQNH